MSKQTTDLGVDIVSVGYYLYRQNGCPFGDNLEGLQRWYQSNIFLPFQAFADDHKEISKT
jgi:hypothetical protein